jgi:hypothetical protein
MSNLPVTDWIPCTTPPVRDGWYDVERFNFFDQIWKTERVRFCVEAGWDRRSSDSGIVVWASSDYWRGVAGDPDAIKE